MPDIARTVLFGVAVFMMVLFPLLYLTRPVPADDD